MADATIFRHVITLDGVDVSLQVTGEGSVNAEESTACIANFVIMPNAGTISAGDYVGVPVTIDHVLIDTLGVVISTTRIFTGTVDTAIYNPRTGLTSFTCTDDLQAKFEAKTQAQIDAILVNGRWSKAVFGEFRDGYRYFEDRLSTYPQSYDYNADGVTGTLVDWAAKATADFTYIENTIYDDSISYSITPKRDLANTYTITYNYRFGRLLHRNHSYSWFLYFCPYFEQSHELPSKDMITTAATSAGWNISTVIEFKELLPSTPDPCGTGANWVVSNEVKDSLALGANWTASRRWSQTATENYTITVDAPQSVAWLGSIPFNEQASNNTDLDADGWSEGTDIPTGRTNSIGDIVIDKYDRTVSDNDIETLIARARTEILDSHRANHVTATIELNPLLQRFHTVALNSNGIDARGKVYSYTHRFSDSDGYARTEVTISVSLNGGAAGSGDSPITAPAAPDTDPTSTAPSSSTELGTYIGNDDTAPDYDDTWEGFTGNYSIAVGTPTPEQIYPRQFRIVTPDINQDSVDAVEGDSSSTYSFDIPNELLTITVS